MSRVRNLLFTVLWLSGPHVTDHGFPLCHDHRSSRYPSVGSVIRQSLLNHRQPFGKRVRDVTVRGQSFIDNGLSTVFVTRSRVREGRQCFKDNVYHFCHPPTTPELLNVTRLSRSTKGGPMIQWSLNNPKSSSSDQHDSHTLGHGGDWNLRWGPY